MIKDKLSGDLGLTTRQIKKIIGNGQSYKKYIIKKYNSTEGRTIYHPSHDLKKLQRWVIENVLVDYPVSQYSTAYEKGCSVARNAKIHSGNSFILHTDIKHFFESINKAHLEALLIDSNSGTYSKEDVEFICQVVLFRGTLTVGSVASPAIANRVMYSFDYRIKERLDEIGEFAYSRYADDIVVSSKKYIPREVLDIIDEELDRLGMQRNLRKTYFSGRKMKRQINGIVLDNNKKRISYGHKRLEELKKEVYRFVTKPEVNNNEKAVILGKLSFLKDVNYDQYQQIIEKYAKYRYGYRL